MADAVATPDLMLERMALPSATSWDEATRTATIVISSDGDVGDGIQLVHREDAIVWPSRPIPALLDHRRTADAVWGVVETLQLERSADGSMTLVGRVKLDGAPDAMAMAEPRLRNGSARFSVGARVRRLDPPLPGSTLDRATSWEVAELSMVVVGRDAKSVMRSDDTVQPKPDLSMSDQLTEKAGSDPAPETVTRSIDPNPQPEPAPVVDQDLQRTAAELRRERDILRLGQDAGLSAEQTDELIRSGKPLSECNREAIRLMRIRLEGGDVQRGEIPAIGHPARVEVTRDAGDTLMRGIQDALETRINPSKQLTDLGREYRGYSLLEYTRMWLENQGVNTRGMTKTELVSRGFHSSSDFPLLFSNLAGKTLDAAYQEEPHTWRPIARQRNLPDFKLASDLIVAADLTPEALLEGGEYKSGTLVEAQHQWKLATYARKVTVTRQAIINDDLSALERVPEMLGRGFRRLESNMIWALITGNATVSVDGKALFHADHGNVASSSVAITTSGFNTARKAMRKQTDIAGNTINLTPSYMLVPTDLEATALQFLFPTGFAPVAITGDSGVAVQAQTAGIQLIVEPRLDGTSDGWYLAASPGAVEGIVYGYLAGEEGPTVTTTEKRDPDGVEILARFDFGCAVKDYRGFYRAKQL